LSGHRGQPCHMIFFQNIFPNPRSQNFFITLPPRGIPLRGFDVWAVPLTVQATSPTKAFSFPGLIQRPRPEFFGAIWAQLDSSSSRRAAVAGSPITPGPPGNLPAGVFFFSPRDTHRDTRRETRRRPPKRATGTVDGLGYFLSPACSIDVSLGIRADPAIFLPLGSEPNAPSSPLTSPRIRGGVGTAMSATTLLNL